MNGRIAAAAIPLLLAGCAAQGNQSAAERAEDYKWAKTFDVTLNEATSASFLDGYSFRVHLAMNEPNRDQFNVIDATEIGMSEISYNVSSYATIQSTTEGDREMPIGVDGALRVFGTFDRDSTVCQLVYGPGPGDCAIQLSTISIDVFDPTTTVTHDYRDKIAFGEEPASAASSGLLELNTTIPTDQVDAFLNDIYEVDRLAVTLLDDGSGLSVESACPLPSTHGAPEYEEYLGTLDGNCGTPAD